MSEQTVTLYDAPYNDEIPSEFRMFGPGVNDGIVSGSVWFHVSVAQIFHQGLRRFTR